VNASAAAALPKRREIVRILGRAIRTGRGAVGLALGGFVVLVAVVGPFVKPHDPYAFVGAPFARPGPGMVLGADILGRDVVSRTLAGGYEILLLALIATALGVTVGAALGITAGYLKGAVDEVTMRILDVALAFPQIILALLLVSIVGPKLWLIALAVAAIHAPQVARVVRAATLRVAEEDYVRYTEAIGMVRVRIMASEILPNVITPILVEFGLRMTYSIALIAGLSFLGFGQQPPRADWGLMINENRLGMQSNPWGVVVPVTLIAVMTIGLNLFTDAMSRAALGLGDTSTEKKAIAVPGPFVGGDLGAS
jgi:peptide/nickel transport system permease protein